MGLRHAAALAVILAALPAVQRTQALDAVALARDYVRSWKQSLAAVVAEETYTQTLRRHDTVRDADSSGPAMRTLVSEVLLVHAQAEGAWLLFRDVFSVDGAPVRDRQERFEALFVRPDAEVIATARRIADESARYNLGTLFRNLNTPATALSFLDERYDSSVRWRKPRRDARDGGGVIELAFEQTRPPYAIRSLKGHAVETRGRFRLEAGSGRISETELNLRIARTRTTMRLICEFGPIPGIAIWVPLRMTEEYRADEMDVRQSRMYEEFKGQAIYTRHRVFQTEARIVGAPR